MFCKETDGSRGCRSQRRHLSLVALSKRGVDRGKTLASLANVDVALTRRKHVFHSSVACKPEQVHLVIHTTTKFIDLCKRCALSSLFVCATRLSCLHTWAFSARVGRCRFLPHTHRRLLPLSKLHRAPLLLLRLPSVVFRATDARGVCVWLHHHHHHDVWL